MLRLRRRGVASFAIAVQVLALSIQLAWAQTVSTAPSARDLITQSVDERNLAALRGNTRPEATPQNDRGAVADWFRYPEVLSKLLGREPFVEVRGGGILDLIEVSLQRTLLLRRATQLKEYVRQQRYQQRYRRN